MAKTIMKCVLLCMVGISTAVLWVYCDGFLPGELIGRGVDASTARLWAGMATLMVLCAAPALPIYRLFPRHALRAAIFIGWVPLCLSAMFADQVEPSARRPFEMGVALIEGGACWIAIVLGAWIVRRFMRPRPG